VLLALIAYGGTASAVRLSDIMGDSPANTRDRIEPLRRTGYVTQIGTNAVRYSITDEGRAAAAVGTIEDRIMDVLEQHPGATIPQLATIAGLLESTARNAVARMHRRGELVEERRLEFGRPVLHWSIAIDGGRASGG
jgi:predicted ArsR family transcriptional regulator